MKNLSEYINNKFFKVITKASRELNYDSYVIGGYVRDILLNRPFNDIDVVTVGSGIELARKTASLIDTKKEVKYYGRFGTAMIRMKDKEIEFVGARRESYEPSSRKPMVEDGTLEDDQNRRDFTINALAISLNENNFGELIDPFNGVEDLKNKIIRTPLDPDITYSDDPLRMMRAIRFATQLNFTMNTCENNLPFLYEGTKVTSRNFYGGLVGKIVPKHAGKTTTIDGFTNNGNITIKPVSENEYSISGGIAYCDNGDYNLTFNLKNMTNNGNINSRYFHIII